MAPNELRAGAPPHKGGGKNCGEIEYSKMASNVDSSIVDKCDYRTNMHENLINLEKYMKSDDWNSILNELKTYSHNTSKLCYRECVSEDALRLLTELLTILVLKVEYLANETMQQVMTECFRCLRNSCAGKPHIQEYVAKKSTALDCTSNILVACLNTRMQDEKYYSCVLPAVQFCGNIVVGNKENQALFWNRYLHLLKILLTTKSNSSKHGNCSAMILYNIILGSPELIVEHDVELLEALIDHSLRDSEFSIFTIELLLQKEGYLADVFPQVTVERRLSLLETAQSLLCLTDSASLEDGKLSVSSVAFLAAQLKARSDCILKTVGHYADALEPIEVSKLLDIVASASSSSAYMEHLQNDMSLLISCAFLLKSIHALGKSGNNSFSSIQKLADLAPSGGSSDIQNHPAFGFKCSLIRLLGNLCWKHRINQDQVRELDVIPLLLDCCNIDARNPLIIQWVVMSVRNLCEGNQANQAVIAAMSRQGAVTSAVLQEMGLTLQDGEEKIVIAPLRR